MSRVNIKMVEYWIGNENPKKVLMEIANSIYDKETWTPEILYNDIVETWKGREE
tara:strand:+ start:42 stop:203 length:162 start_codon:yes stop_codon:yes gene_type:complete